MDFLSKILTLLCFNFRRKYVLIVGFTDCFHVVVDKMNDECRLSVHIQQTIKLMQS